MWKRIRDFNHQGLWEGQQQRKAGGGVTFKKNNWKEIGRRVPRSEEEKRGHNKILSNLEKGKNRDKQEHIV